MTSSKITTFDEIAYRQDLERAGLSPEDAATLAAKTARIRNDALADAAYKRGLVEAGMQLDKAQRLTEAARAFKGNPEPKPAPVARVEGFQAMGDIFGDITPKAKPQKPAAELPVIETPAEVEIGRAHV